MKIRNGFVSNSSSSSFIIGLANVKDKPGDFTFDFDDHNLPYGLTSKYLRGDKYELTLESFTGNYVSIEAEEGDNILYLDGVGPDDDSDFAYCDSNGDFSGYDYDIELEEFDDDDIAKFKHIQEFNGDATYGAGRDG